MNKDDRQHIEFSAIPWGSSIADAVEILKHKYNAVCIDERIGICVIKDFIFADAHWLVSFDYIYKGDYANRDLDNYLERRGVKSNSSLYGSKQTAIYGINFTLLETIAKTKGIRCAGDWKRYENNITYRRETVKVIIPYEGGLEAYTCFSTIKSSQEKYDRIYFALTGKYKETDYRHFYLNHHILTLRNYNEGFCEDSISRPIIGPASGCCIAAKYHSYVNDGSFLCEPSKQLTHDDALVVVTCPDEKIPYPIRLLYRCPPASPFFVDAFLSDKEKEALCKAQMQKQQREEQDRRILEEKRNNAREVFNKAYDDL